MISSSKSNDGISARKLSSAAPDVPVAVFRKIPKETKRLEWLANEKKKALNYASCWISKTGKLCMKKREGGKVVSIQSEEDLLDLK